MKNFFCVLAFLLLSSCFGLNTDNQKEREGDVNTIGTLTGEDISASGNTMNEEKKLDVLSIDIQNNENGIFSLSPLSANMFKNQEIEMKGRTLSSNIEKIEVSFENKDSTFPPDRYLLQTYKKGDTDFRYVAGARFRVLDYGTNTYTFTAFLSSGETVQVGVTIYLPYGNDYNIVDEVPPLEIGDITYQKSLFGEKGGEQYISFPKSTLFGEPIFDGEKNFTYSNIENFDVKKVGNISFSCEKPEELTNFLIEQYGMVFWHTCRPIAKDKGFSFYTLRLEGKVYFYEKHYVDLAHSLLGVVLLETGEGITKENIEEKNTEFKEKQYDQVDLTDALMYEIAR